MSSADGLVKFTHRHLDRLCSSLSRVMATRDLEAVHELRVSSRRLAEPLELLGRLADRASSRWARRSLRRMRNSLCVVRDLDVLRMSLAEAGNGGLREPEDVAKLQGILAIQREAELIAARSVLVDMRIGRVKREIASLLKTIRRREPLENHLEPAREARKLWKRKARALLDRPPERDQGMGIHKTRIRLKALRYATELMGRIDGQNRDDFLRQLTAMQDRLGTWNDHFCAVRLLSELARDEQTLAAGSNWSAAVMECAVRRARAMSAEVDEILMSWPRLRTAIESLLSGKTPSESGAAPRAAVADPKLAMEHA